MLVPNCDFAFIGGSSTLNIDIPEDLQLDYIEIEDDNLVYETPFGNSPSFRILKVNIDEISKKVITCQMHGWRGGISRSQASRQIFWVFREAGVQRVIAEGGVGSVNHLLKPRDILIPHDYMDFSMRKDVGLDDKYLLVMRDAICPEMRKELVEVCEQYWDRGRVFDRGVYANTDGRHFESPSEIAYYRMAGADIAGQSICPEVYLAREIGACYAGIYIIVNYGEGVISPWEHEELADIFYNEGCHVGRIIFELIKRLPVKRSCNCREMRKETLLKKIYKKIY